MKCDHNSFSEAFKLLTACSPVALFQLVYKTIYLVAAVLPAAVKSGGWPDPTTLALLAYAPIVLFCAPWGYLLRAGRRQPGDEINKSE